MTLLKKLRLISPHTIEEDSLWFPIVQEDAVIDTHPTQEEVAEPVIVENHWPQLLNLTAVLQPIPFSPSPVLVQQKCLDKTYLPMDLYHHNKGAEQSWAALAFAYKGEGSAFFSETHTTIFFKNSQLQEYHFFTPHPLYVKPFAHQQTPGNSLIFQELYLNSQREWVPELNKAPYRPLYPFGGIYAPGLSLEHMQPLYFHISSYQEKTVIFIESHQSKNENILQPQKIPFQLMQTMSDEESCSVAEALRAGFAHITLFHKEGGQKKYRSCGFETLIPNQNLYNIFYRME